MKALSIRQPWAWLIVNGWKNVENRDWSTTYRGRVLIHASATLTRPDYFACQIYVRCLAPSLAELIPAYHELPRGGIVGEAELVDCVREHPSEWFEGRFGFVLDHVRPLPFRPCKGKLHFFEIEVAE